MLYNSELHYFFDTPGFPFEKAVKVTGKQLSAWCRGYRAELLSPKKEVKAVIKAGLLPDRLKERKIFAENIVTWIFDNSVCNDLFALFLYKKYPPEKDKPAKFDHHDDTCCWFLDLAPKEFDALKTSWKKNGLPADLFYPNSQAKLVPNRAGFITKGLKSLGFKVESFTCYTPLRWKYRK
ncbi:MAG: hypothetical protein ABH879_00225 [archaeon]